MFQKIASVSGSTFETHQGEKITVRWLIVLRCETYSLNHRLGQMHTR